MKGRILLEDGSIFEGKSFGAAKTVCGELVFNTGMTGYEEILTDPSYAGQIITMTYPLIGNYGINEIDAQSDHVQIEGLIVKEYAEVPSHWQSKKDISSYLKENDIPGISGIDTRMLTKRIRDKGTMKCMLTTKEPSKELFEQLTTYHYPKDIIAKVSIPYPKIYKGRGRKIGIVDLGLKNGILQQLIHLNCHITIFPHDVKSSSVLQSGVEVLLLSNGPGDPKNASCAIQTTKDLIGKLPIWGICLGHQVIALALGGDTYKLKFGHRGSNHPVLNLDTGKVYISSQNHGYCVKGDGLPNGLKVTYINVNDDTIEGLYHEEYKISSVQFHPEEGPGAEDAHYIFENWLQNLERLGESHAEKSIHS